jgi:alkanesulfonate monooxygenase SsuD/methylene tetrahydromethanopterin reductase-like flavin-dependent oxidoreductase (luciferase family)
MSVGVLFTQGLVTGDPHAVLGEILEQAEAADRLGFSHALTTEHKYSEEYFGSPLHLSFAIAARTSRVRVGTAIAIAPLYNPVELAQDAAMLDQLSGGRAWLGLGVGYMPVDYATVGVPWTTAPSASTRPSGSSARRTRTTGSPFRRDLLLRRRRGDPATRRRPVACRCTWPRGRRAACAGPVGSATAGSPTRS